MRVAHPMITATTSIPTPVVEVLLGLSNLANTSCVRACVARAGAAQRAQHTQARNNRYGYHGGGLLSYFDALVAEGARAHVNMRTDARRLGQGLFYFVFSDLDCLREEGQKIYRYTSWLCVDLCTYVTPCVIIWNTHTYTHIGA